jgi:signal transduction histidine kinase
VDGVAPEAPARRPVVAWLLVAATAAAAVGHGLLPGVPATDAVVIGIFTLGTALSGALVATRRPANTCGWLLLGVAVVLSCGAANQSYAQAATAAARSWPLAEAAAWVASWLAVPGFAGLGFLVLLYPSGRLPSSRWRVVAWAGTAGAAGLAVSNALRPGPLPATTAVDNPLGVAGAGGALELLETAGSLVLMWFALASLVALALRFSGSTGATREQVKWLLYAAGMAAVTLVFAGVASGVLNELSFYLAVAGLLAIPVAVAVAILGHDLLDIDAVINRTAVYGVLTLGVGAVYVLVAAGFGTVIGERLPVGVSLVATAIVAVVLVPLRGVLQRVADRAMYGERHDPYRALTGLARELAGARPPGEILGGVAETVARALRLAHARLDVRRGDAFEEIARHGDAGAGDGHPFDLTHRGELVGRLVVAAAPGETLSRRDTRLVEDLAVHVGGLVHGARLAQDLDRSRAALVTTRTDERRRLRRDLHDGLGPGLAGIAFGLGAARNRLRDDPDAVEALLERLQAQARGAVGEVRGLVEGLAPVELEEAGLTESIRAGAARIGFGIPPGGERIGFGIPSGCELSVDAGHLGPLPAALELAAYRIVMEALANVARHARATRTWVSLRRDAALCLEVADDGDGMPSGFVAGVGVASMRARAAELGGTLTIEPRPGGGTTVACRLPGAGG